MKKLTILSCAISSLLLSTGVAFADSSASGSSFSVADEGIALTLSNEEMISDLVAKWGTDESTAYQLEATLEHADASKLAAALEAEGLDEITSILGGGFEPETLSDTTEDYTLTPVSPCRIVDTRLGGGGIMYPGTAREFYVYGPNPDIAPQGGNPAGCPSPVAEPLGVVVNVTAVPSSSGHFRVYPANVTTPNASLVNYKPGVNIANAVSVKTYFAFGPKELEVYSAGTSHVIIDVMGYYERPERTPSDNYVTSSGIVEIPVGVNSVYAPPCPSGYRLSGGGGAVNEWTRPVEYTGARPVLGISPSIRSGANAVDRYLCQFDNNDTVPRDVWCQTICTRSPGR